MGRAKRIAAERKRPPRTPRRAPSGWWWFAGLIVAVAIVLGFASILGIARIPVVAGVIAARNALTVAAAAGAVVVLALACIRPVRFLALPIAVALAVTTAISAPIVLARGVVNASPAPVADGQLRILSWNINADTVSAESIASEAVAVHANIIVLPDIQTNERAILVASLKRQNVVMVPRMVRGNEVLVLTAASLKRTDTVSAGSASLSASLALHPSDPHQPSILALHAARPTLHGNADWRAEVAWVAGECAKGDTIVAGDFNATLDVIGESGLGGCRDAAAAVHAASVGSWPTALPTWLAMPIDHILVGPAWKVESFTVLTDQDASGSRHRPIFAVLTHR